MDCNARGERNPLQVYGWVRLEGGAWWAVIEALSTWVLSGQLAYVLEKWANTGKFVRLPSGFSAYGGREGKKRGC